MQLFRISKLTKGNRCTDCGGGGGPRVGIGKWRLKQVFLPGRKTCSLSHNRVGDRPKEIGVHCPQIDFTPDQLKEVLSRCHALWTEKTLSRLAVPEMLEYVSVWISLSPSVWLSLSWPGMKHPISKHQADGKRCWNDRIDLPPNYINPLKTYEDVAEILAKNWPTRQALFDQAVPDQFKRLLGLTVGFPYHPFLYMQLTVQRADESNAMTVGSFSSETEC